MGEKFFIVQKSLVPAGEAEGHHNHAFKGNLLRKFLVERKQYIVNDQKAILRVVDDGGNFLRVQPQVERALALA